MSIEILHFDHDENKYGEKVHVGYFKSNLKFLNYLAKNNDQHLPMSYQGSIYHVVVDKVNSYKNLDKNLNKNLDKNLDSLIKNQIPKNSPEFLKQEQYYAMFFGKNFKPTKNMKLTFPPPPVLGHEEPPKPPLGKPPKPPPLLNKKGKRKKKRKEKRESNLLHIVVFIALILLALALGWFMG
jgi:hypothetical protein